MQNQIKIGKSYPASFILEKMEENHNVDISFGHIVVEYKTEKKHKYFIDKSYIKKLNDTLVKVYTIIPTASCKNFLFKLLEQKDVREILEEAKENPKICCVILESDLENVGFKSGKRKAITRLNNIFKSNKMTFKASSHINGIKITYKKLKEEECN